MKAIYDAVRAIAYPGQAQHKAGSAFSTGSFRAKAREAMKHFELTNRGIRHKLDTPVFSTNIDAMTYYALPPTDWDARERLYRSFAAMVDALRSGTHPDVSRLMPLYQAQDDSGWAELYASKMFEAMMKPDVQSRLKLNEKLGATGTLTFVDDKVELKLRIWAADLGMYEDMDEAYRTLVIDIDGRTIEGLVQLEKVIREKLRELFKDARQWEEFEGYRPYDE